VTPCLACADNDRLESLPPREMIEVTGSWRVAHAFGTSLPGWLVLLPNTHVRALHELTDDAAAELGPLLTRVSQALSDVLGCEKAYVAFFAEADGFEHLHLHVMPRMDWFGPDERGPAVFSRLGRSADTEVPEADRDALALKLRAALQTIEAT
jgi:diadenosine tetraphosphate (Ap4A) HIT family hydrolase